VATVLVVDDDERSREIMERFIRQAGYDALLAKDGEEGIVLALQHRPDLIVLDLTMPGKDGLTACQELRRFKRTAQIPIIMVSSQDSAWDRRDALRRGANDYLTKPLDRQTFQERLKLFLG
jgi:DNA-binding response OmpR family regulator